MKDNQEPNNFCSLADSKKEVPSEFTPQYLQFYGLTHSKFNELKREILEEVQKIVILDLQRDFRSKILIKTVSCSKGCEFMHFQVNLGYFIFPRIDVFIQNTESLAHSLFYSRAGNFGRVYRAHCFNQEIAIKCFSYTKQTFSKVLSQALSEYCFLKLASFLRMGPKLPSKTGYELIIYQDCIEFAMEYCEQIFYYTEIGQKQGQQLKESLLKIHLLNQMHLDIKPDNIRYSTSYQKYVFIDFGFTKFIKEDLGFKTKTYFRGTVGYCSEQMKRLYELSQQGYADLYYNDIKGLANVLSNDENKKTTPEGDYMQQKLARKAKFGQIEDITVHHLKYSIKYLASQGHHSAAMNAFDEYKRIFQGRIPNEKYKHVLLVTQPNTFEQIVDKKQQESEDIFIESVVKCISDINQYSSSEKFDSWNEDKSYEINIISNGQGQAQKELYSYYHILSRVLKINSTKYTYQEKNSMAKTAADVLGISQTVIHENKHWDSCPEISYLSKILLKFSLQSNSQKSAQIFINVSFNIFALKILDFDEIVQCFKQITQEKHGKTIEMMLALYKGFYLLFYLTDRFDAFQKCRGEIQIIAMQFIQKFPQGIFKQVLRIIFSFELTQRRPEIPSNTLEKYKEKMLYEEMKDFASHLLELSLYSKSVSEQQQYEKDLEKLIKKKIQKSLRQVYFQFQHYHFLWLVKYFQQDKHEEYLKIYRHFSNIFHDKCIKFISLQLIQLNFALQETPTKTIHIFSHILGQIKNKSFNSIIKDNIQTLIQNIILGKYYIFTNMDQKCQSTILECYATFKVNICKDDIDRSIVDLLRAVRKAQRLQEYYPQAFRKYVITNESGLKVNFIYNSLKSYYDQLKQLVIAQKQMSLTSLILVMVSLHFLKQNFDIAKQLYNAISPVFARTKSLKYLHYQYFFLIFNRFTDKKDVKEQIYINYVDLIESNKQIDYLFRRKKTFGLIFSYFYEHSSKLLPIFINRMAKYLFICNEKRFVDTYIQVSLVSLTQRAKKLDKYDILKSVSITAIDKIEPISKNAYNSLFFFHMISLDFIKADKSIFVRIFKAFPFIKSNAQEYICRTIYEKYFDTFHKELPKRKAKSILFIAMINQPNLVKFSLFKRLFKLNKQNASIQNAPQKSLQSHLKRFYNNQENREHYSSYLQKKISETRKNNFKVASSFIFMRHLKSLEADS